MEQKTFEHKSEEHGTPGIPADTKIQAVKVPGTGDGGKAAKAAKSAPKPNKQVASAFEIALYPDGSYKFVDVGPLKPLAAVITRATLQAEMAANEDIAVMRGCLGTLAITITFPDR